MKSRTIEFVAAKEMRVLELELPPIGPRQVLLKTKGCALCTWEQRFYKGGSPDDYPFRGGHEVSAVVADIGPDCTADIQVGDLVAPALKTRCGSCYYCRRGLDNQCENDPGPRQPGQPWGPGGLSDYLIVEDYQVYRADPGVDPDHLALAEPVACVLRSVSRPALFPGDRVLIQGAGMMGQLHILLAKRRALEVIVSEPMPARREQALESGADVVLDPTDSHFREAILDRTGGYGANAVFFTAGGGPAIDQALKVVAKGGWLCLYGSVHPSGEINVDPNHIHYDELFVTGTFSHTRESYREAVELISQAQIDVSPFITERVPFPEGDYGFERAISSDTYRVLMRFQD